MSAADDVLIQHCKFICPPNYKEEQLCNESELYVEDLRDEDTELFLIQTPSNIDTKIFDGCHIYLDEENFVRSSNKEHDKKFKSIVTETNDVQPFHLVLPSRKREALRAVKKPFKGQILITEVKNFSGSGENNVSDELSTNNVLNFAGIEIKEEPCSESSFVSCDDNSAEHVGKSHRHKKKTKTCKVSSKVSNTERIISEGNTSSLITESDNLNKKSKKKRHSKKVDHDISGFTEIKAELVTDEER